MNTCRFCKGWAEPLFKYGPRHYCHAACGFNHFGPRFLEELPVVEIRRLPFAAVKAAGFTFESIGRYINIRLEINHGGKFK